MATKEKPKKGNGGMHVYKLDTGGCIAPPSPVVTKKMVSSSRSWGFLRRSKTYRENDIEGIKLGEKVNVVVEKGRNSVSNHVTESRRSTTTVLATEGRRSVAEKVEAENVGAVAGFLKVKVLVTDMPGFMQVHAFRCARGSFDCLDKFTPKTLAHSMKKEFDKVYGPAWHCIVGSSFGSFVTHSTGCFLYFGMDNLYILVFRTKVKKAMD